MNTPTTPSKLGEEGLKFLVDTFEKLNGLKDTDILKNLIEHVENIQTLAEEKLYAARIGLAFFRDIIDSEAGSALIPTSEKARVDDYLDKLELVMEERMFTTTEITKLVKGRQKKRCRVWRENFIRIAKHKELFEGGFPDINDLEEEEEENKGEQKKKNVSSSASVKVPAWMPIVFSSILVMSALSLVLSIFCFSSIHGKPDADEVKKMVTEAVTPIVDAKAKAIVKIIGDKVDSVNCAANAINDNVFTLARANSKLDNKQLAIPDDFRKKK